MSLKKRSALLGKKVIVYRNLMSSRMLISRPGETT